MRPFIICAFALVPALPAAQSQAQRASDSSTATKVLSWERKISAPKEGVILPEFYGLKMDGSPFTHNQLQQRISMILFWYPSCNCIDPQSLEPFLQFQNNPRFQLVSIMSDSFNYTAFMREKPVPGIHVNLNSHEKHFELSMGGPYPSAMLVDASGRVIKASGSFHKGYFDEAEWTARIREALLF